MFNLKKVPHHGSVENLIFTNVLGGVCRSRSEGQTEEDFRQEIFELRQRSMRRLPSGNLRVNPRHCGNPLCDISRKPIQHCTHFKCVIRDFYIAQITIVLRSFFHYKPLLTARLFQLNEHVRPCKPLPGKHDFNNIR